MAEKLPPCIGCGVSPAWTQIKPKWWRFSCDCNGFDVEILQDDAPDEAVFKMQAAIEQAYCEERAAVISKTIFGTKGAVQ